VIPSIVMDNCFNFLCVFICVTCGRTTCILTNFIDDLINFFYVFICLTCVVDLNAHYLQLMFPHIWIKKTN
jgi:hypothetical protein